MRLYVGRHGAYTQQVDTLQPLHVVSTLLLLIHGSAVLDIPGTVRILERIHGLVRIPHGRAGTGDQVQKEQGTSVAQGQIDCLLGRKATPRERRGGLFDFLLDSFSPGNLALLFLPLHLLGDPVHHPGKLFLQLNVSKTWGREFEDCNDAP